jgi:selenocysteine lyase/cysteine desulfurase
VTIRVSGWAPNELVSSLQERFSIVSRAVSEPVGTRFCTAYFNTEREVEKVAEAVSSLAKEREGRRNKEIAGRRKESPGSAI